MKKTTILSAIALLLFLFLAGNIKAQTYINENFNGGIPGTWSVSHVNCTWDWRNTTTGFRGGGQYLDGTEFAIFDSDAMACMSSATDYLISPVFDASAATIVKIEFDQYYRQYSGDRGYVQVWDGAAWNTVVTYSSTQGGWGAPNHPCLDITAYKNANMQIRFKYTNAWGWYWSVDNVKVTAPELIAPSISYTNLSNTSSTANRTASSFATITDASGVNITAGTKPRIYYKKSTNANTYNNNTNATDGWKYAEATNAVSPFDFTINYSLLFGGGGVAVGNTIQYFIVAQDNIICSPNVGINSGTFAATPTSVALTAAAFPLGGTINSYDIVPACSNGDWLGTTVDWFTASNWCNSTIPTSAINATIPVTSNNPVISGAAAVCNSLTINSGGATLTINPGASLTASGATTNDGTFTIKADATGMGSFIDNGTVGGTGTFNMEQYLTGAGGGSPTGRGWYIGSPMASATSNVYKGAGGYKLWSYSEPTQAYTEITNTTTPLNPMQGYVARSGGNSTVTFTGGAFNTGNFTNASMTHKPSAISHEGYTLIGNPYPSSLDWDLAIAASTNLSTTIWYRSYNGAAMVFDTYNSTGGVGTNNNGSGAVTQYIPPTQAVWVEAPTQSVTGTLNFTNAMRSNQPTARLLKKESDTDANVIRLMIDDGNTTDETIILFNTAAKNTYDNFDSHKMFADATVPQLYTTTGKDTLVINGLNSVATNPVIDLGVKFPATGNYAINAKSFNFRVTLEDKQLNVFQNLTQDSIYKFSATKGNITNRFALHFVDVTGIANTSVANNIQVYQTNNGIVVVDLNGYEEPQGTITVSDVLGRRIATQKITAKTSLLELHNAIGVYVVQVQTQDKVISKKIVIQ